MKDQDITQMETEITEAIKQALAPWLKKIPDPRARAAIEVSLLRGTASHLHNAAFRRMQILNGGLVFVPNAEAEIVFKGEWPYVQLADRTEHQQVDNQDEGYWIYKR